MTDRPTKVSRPRVWDRAGVALFCVGAGVAGVWLMVLGRGLTFFYDEWDFVDTPGRSFLAFDLSSHNGHPVVLPYAVYRAAFALVGLGHYWPYLLLVVLLNIACGWLLFALLRRRVHPVIAASGACVLMLLGPAWQDLLWPFQIGFLGSIAGGLGSLLLLDRRQTVTDVGAALCLVVAVFCSGIGLALVAGVSIELLWRRRDWRRLWIILIPSALFAIWYVANAHDQAPVAVPPLTAGARYMGSATAAAVGSIIGRDTTLGGTVAALLAILIVIALVRGRSRASRLAMAVTGGIAFWLLTLFTRGADPTASRYLYPGAVFVLLAVGELPALLMRRDTQSGSAGTHSTVTRKRTEPVFATVFTLLVVTYSGLAIWWNSGVLEAGRSGLLSASQTVRSELSAVQLVGGLLSPSFRPDTVAMPQVRTGPYLSAVAAYGSPAIPAYLLRLQPASVRTAVDAMLLRGLPMQIREVALPPAAEATCRTSSSGSGTITDLPTAGMWITAPEDAHVNLRFRSFSPVFIGMPKKGIGAGHTVHVTWTGDRSAIRWQVWISDPLASEACKP